MNLPKPQKCIHYESKPYRNCYGCDKDYEANCPQFEVDDVELAEPQGDSSGLERLFRPKKDGNDGDGK